MTGTADEVYCSSYGESIKKKAELCPHCGVRQSSSRISTTNGAADEEFCTTCGEKVKKDAELCPNCGVRRHGTSPSDISTNGKSASYYLGWGFGILFVLASFGAFGDGGSLIVSFLQGIALLIVGLILLPPVRERIDERKHTLTTMGWVQSVDERTIGHVDEPCSACYGSVSEGVERRYAEEFVVLGVVLHTFKSGENTYCRTCANGQSSEQVPILEEQ
jgi:RNA polymerase subunit RPABC4/transcription elongation factor Spt4